MSTNGAPFRLLTSNDQWFDFTDDGWKHYSREQQAHVETLAAERRANADELAYWKTRHDLARAEIAKKTPIAIPTSGATNPIDAFIGAKLEASHTQPAALTDDGSFLRRVTLDTIGLLPTPEELTAFLADPGKDKRAKAIDRLLADPRGADEWIPYWQDVLAENPAILKATLNNTGPFRFLPARRPARQLANGSFRHRARPHGRQRTRRRQRGLRRGHAKRPAHGQQGADRLLRLPRHGDEMRALPRCAKSSLRPSRSLRHIRDAPAFAGEGARLEPHAGA
ncbi:MAG: DUF1549 domain-containing protein [Chthoniobacter sp.]